MFIRHPTKDQLLPDDAELEAGWIRHDGSRRVASESYHPLILLRDGTIFRPISPLPNKWAAFYKMCRWKWEGCAPNAFDVIAYQLFQESGR